MHQFLPCFIFSSFYFLNFIIIILLFFWEKILNSLCFTFVQVVLPPNKSVFGCVVSHGA